MLKKICTYTFIFLLTISNILGNAETITQEAAVIKAFNESGANFEEANINSHVTIRQYITIDNAGKICNDIAERLELSQVSKEKREEEGLSEIVIHGLIEENIYTTILVQSTHYQDIEESTIVLDIIDTKGEYDLQGLCGKIKNILSPYGRVIMNITFTGNYDAKLNTKDKQEIINRVFKIIKAKKVEGIKGDNLVSITGYTPWVAEHISYNNNKVNINIALRYNSYKEKTNIWIGNPLIVTGY